MQQVAAGWCRQGGSRCRQAVVAGAVKGSAVVVAAVCSGRSYGRRWQCRAAGKENSMVAGAGRLQAVVVVVRRRCVVYICVKVVVNMVAALAGR